MRCCRWGWQLADCSVQSTVIVDGANLMRCAEVHGHAFAVALHVALPVDIFVNWLQ